MPRWHQPSCCDFKLYPSVTTQKCVLLKIKIKIANVIGAGVTPTQQVHAPTMLLLPAVGNLNL